MGKEAELHGQTTLSNGPTPAWRTARRWPKIEDCGELFHDNLSPGTSHKSKSKVSMARHLEKQG